MKLVQSWFIRKVFIWGFTEDDLSQLKLHEDPPEAGNILASSSRTFDDLFDITFSHLAPSPGITLEGLAGLQTP